jgi:hypothetical protein
MTEKIPENYFSLLDIWSINPVEPDACFIRGASGTRARRIA